MYLQLVCSPFKRCRLVASTHPAASARSVPPSACAPAPQAYAWMGEWSDESEWTVRVVGARQHGRFLRLQIDGVFILQGGSGDPRSDSPLLLRNHHQKPTKVLKRRIAPQKLQLSQRVADQRDLMHRRGRRENTDAREVDQAKVVGHAPAELGGIVPAGQDRAFVGFARNLARPGDLFGQVT